MSLNPPPPLHTHTCIGLFWRVQMMDLVTYAVLFVALTVLNTWLVAFSYRKTKIALKHK